MNGEIQGDMKATLGMMREAFSHFALPPQPSCRDAVEDDRPDRGDEQTAQDARDETTKQRREDRWADLDRRDQEGRR